MRKRPKLDPMSILLSIRDKRPEPRKVMPLTTLAPEEVAAFQALRAIIEQSKLLQYLDKKDGERFVCINEALVEQNYPGLDPLSGRMPGIDAFIYVYDGITSHELRRKSTPGDVRQFLGEIGFRQLLLELDKACKIHRYCCERVRSSAYVTEPITKKYLYDARREALLIHARAREVFQQIAHKIHLEMVATDLETPPVYRDAYQFSCEMKQALEPLARIGKQIRMFASA
jgi:hypothetical protein